MDVSLSHHHLLTGQAARSRGGSQGWNRSSSATLFNSAFLWIREHMVSPHGNAMEGMPEKGRREKTGGGGHSSQDSAAGCCVTKGDNPEQRETRSSVSCKKQSRSMRSAPHSFLPFHLSSSCTTHHCWGTMASALSADRLWEGTRGIVDGGGGGG